MASAEVKRETPVTPPIVEVTLTLSPAEAEVILGITGSLTGGPETAEVYHVLREAVDKVYGSQRVKCGDCGSTYVKPVADDRYGRLELERIYNG